MYALQDYVGEATVNRALQRLIELRAYETNPYATTLDFLNILREEAGSEHEEMIHDFFERIVLFDLGVTDAGAVQREDGRWVVDIEVEAHKFVADGDGAEREEAMDYMIDVAVFSGDPDQSPRASDHVLYMRKHRVDDTTIRLELTVDEEPGHVAIDPYQKLIDRDSGNNAFRIVRREARPPDE